MSGPFIPPRAGQPLDMLLETHGQGGWEELDALLNPALPAAELEPSDEIAKFLYGLSTTPQGRAIVEWLMDITLRQPLRVTGRSLEETALNAALRQGINGVGEVVLKAIAKGEQLVIETRNGGGKS